MTGGRPRPGRTAPPPPPPRSHAAIPVAVVVVGVGLYLARFSVLLPFLLGLALSWAGVAFLSTRLNPLSPHFYLTTKPSWSAIGVVFLGAVALVGGAYAMYRARYAPILPHL